METLVVVQHRNQYCCREKSQISDGFVSSPSRGFKGVNCRTFESSIGILSSPDAVLPMADTPLVRKNSAYYSEPIKQIRRSNPIPINLKPTSIEDTFFNDDDILCSELWAGPTYSNSPPPSSLPMPTFSLCQKRSFSFELPTTDSDIDIHPTAKSAPSSPTRFMFSSSVDDFSSNNAYATENLRRILNLDVGNGC